jgi:molecular chaperone GrpE
MISNTSDIEARLEEEKQKRLQLMSDFQNYQKRVEGEKALFGAMANMGLVREMLEIFDDLNLALADSDLNLEHAKASMKSAQDKIVSTIESAGVERIEVKVGDEFNKDHMEAITTVPSEDKKGKVIAVISSAFKYKDKEGVLKPAKVVVGK